MQKRGAVAPLFVITVGRKGGVCWSYEIFNRVVNCCVLRNLSLFGHEMATATLPILLESIAKCNAFRPLIGITRVVPFISTVYNVKAGKRRV
jgi:hypothetical protein